MSSCILLHGGVTTVVSGRNRSETHGGFHASFGRAKPCTLVKEIAKGCPQHFAPFSNEGADSGSEFEIASVFTLLLQKPKRLKRDFQGAVHLAPVGFFDRGIEDLGIGGGFIDS